MLKKFRFFKRFKKLVFGGFSIVCGVVTCCLLGSWTYNNNTLVWGSNNLINSYTISNLDSQFINTDNTGTYLTNDYLSYTSSMSDERTGLFNISFNNLTNNERFFLVVANDDDYGLQGSYIFSSESSQYNGATYYTQYAGYIHDSGYFDSLYNQINTHEIPVYEFTNGQYVSIIQLEYSSSVTYNFYIPLLSMDGFQGDTYYGDAFTLYATKDPFIYQSLDNVPDNLIDYNEYNNLLQEYNFYQSTHSYTDTQYSNLQQEYTGYQASHSYTNTQYNTLNNNYNSLSQEYNDYQASHTYSNTQYDYLNNLYHNYMSTHEYSNQQYADLYLEYSNYQISHSYTNTQYTTLQGQYSNLQQDYDILLSQYNELLNSSSFDIQQYHLSVAKKVNNQITWDFSDITSIGSSDYIDSFGFLNTSGIYNDYISDYDCILVHLDSPVNILNYDLMFNPNAYGGNINLVIKLIRNGTESVEWYPINDNTQGLSSETISLTNLVKYLDANVTSLNAYTYQDFAIVYTNQGNFLSNIKLNGQGDYNLGFLNGVAQNNRDFLELQSDYDTLENNYNTLESNFENLQERYNDLANTDLGFSMSKLMWNIASTPFESFKSIWSVNFLDFNIASFITGILSIFVIVWLLKKIF